MRGRRWLPKGKADQVSVHDFPHLGKGKAIPYGAYDIALNRAVVNVGVTHDTAEFAAESIRRWWRLDGRAALPGGSTVAHLRRQRRQQWQTDARLETAPRKR